MTYVDSLKARGRLVRYVSPFGSPASMRPELAEMYRAQDERLFSQMEEYGLLDERMRRIGRPRVGDDVFRSADLPVWVAIDPDDPEEPFATMRAFIRTAERDARETVEAYVVARRDEGGTMFTAFPKRLLLPEDLVVWECDVGGRMKR